jgi:pimeloyl-ACP methyl ester carboxylesterase
VVAVDLPGFGNSEALPEGFSITDVASAVDTWRLSQGIESAVVIGHSLGGYIALALARKNSAWVQGLGLFHSTALADSEEKKASRSKVVEFLQRNGSAAWTDNFIPGLFRDPRHPAVEGLRRKAAAVSAETLIGYTRAMRERGESLEFLKTATFPVFYIAGAYDTAVTLESVLQQQKGLPRTQLHVEQEIGHMGMLEAPEACFSFISGWLKALPRERPG